MDSSVLASPADWQEFPAGFVLDPVTECNSGVILVGPAAKDNYNSGDFHQNSLTDSISLVILSIRMGFFVIHSLESISGSVFHYLRDYSQEFYSEIESKLSLSFTVDTRD